MWYITRSGKKAGPFSLEQLAALSKQKKLKETDLVWKEGMKEWINCLSSPEISHFFKNSTPEFPPLPNTTNDIKKDNKSISSQKTIIDDNDAEENEDNIPVILINKNKKKIEKKKSIVTFMRIGLAAGMISLLLLCSCCLFFVSTGARKVVEKAAEIKAIKDAKSVNGPNEIEIEAKIGVPVEIEPGHVLFFNQQGNGTYTTYLEGLIGVGAGQRVHEKVSSIVVIVSNFTNDGKIWDWKGFSDISSMRDEFGNQLQHYIIPNQIIDSGSSYWYLDNRPMSVAPKKQEVYLLAFELLPETSKQFEVKLKYGKSLIILKGARGESAK